MLLLIFSVILGTCLFCGALLLAGRLRGPLVVIGGRHDEDDTGSQAAPNRGPRGTVRSGSVSSER
jgi:hypothetical protein